MPKKNCSYLHRNQLMPDALLLLKGGCGNPISGGGPLGGSTESPRCRLVF